jgi:hypothetical protein
MDNDFRSLVLTKEVYMRLFSSTSIGYFLLTGMILLSLTGCNLAAKDTTTPTLNVTQAYQTVEARLTEAVALTPKVTSTPPSVATFTPTVPTPPATAPVETSTPAATNPPTSLCDQAAPGNPIDVTIPDNTKLQPGEEFTKTWRLQNAGTCPWTKDYALVWFSGEQFNAPASVPLDGDVAPGNTVDLSVDMQAPQTPASYISYWKLRNSNSVLFGIGPSGGSAFWVQIEVVPATTTTITPTAPTTATPTITPTPGVQVQGPASLQIGDLLDLDALQVNLGSEDLAYQATDQDRALAPVGSAGLAVFGASQPTFTDCQNINLGGQPVVINDLVGSYLCYRTNMALPGWLLITALDPTTGILNVDIFTWAIP